jgi:hypothetical protein
MTELERLEKIAELTRLNLTSESDRFNSLLEKARELQVSIGNAKAQLLRASDTWHVAEKALAVYRESQKRP